MFFEREIYPELIKWAQKFDVALFLEGPRQVGKTSLLLKLGQEHFKNCVHIDLKRKGAEIEERIKFHEGNFKRSVPPEEMGFVWEAVFKDLDDTYTNDPKTLVILDEIQESPLVHNTIRYFRRGLKSKLAVSGSYLGIIYQSDEYWDSTGDIINYKLSSLSFREFLKADGVYEEFESVETVDFAQMTEDERAAAGIKQSSVRLSIGLENVCDIIADLEGALR